MIIASVLAALLFAIVPPTPDHFVTDTQSVLSPATRSALEQRLHAYEAKTGNQIIVFIGDTTGDVPLEEWTAQTAQTWKIGHAKHDNGAVLFVFMRDHRVRIEVGYGLESVLTDATTKRIIDTRIVPRMKAGNVDAAIQDGVSAMLAAASPGYAGASPMPDATTTSSGDLPDWAVLFLILAAFGLFVVLPIAIIAIVVSRKRREKFGKAFHDMWFWNPAGGSGGGTFFGGYGGGGGFSSGGGGGFSAGGGSFGGGGASGGW